MTSPRNWPSPIEETIDQLDQLHQSNLQRQSNLRDQLKATVDVASFDAPDDSLPASTNRQGGRAGRSAYQESSDRPPYVPMPRRTTHGGPFGPVVRAKIEQAIIAKGGIW